MGFQFGDNHAVLDICGKTYKVNPFSPSVLNGRNKYAEGLKMLNAGEGANTPEMVRSVCALVANMVDAVLGPNAYNAIFPAEKRHDAKPDFLEHQELATYLHLALETFIKKRQADFVGNNIRFIASLARDAQPQTAE